MEVEALYFIGLHYSVLLLWSLFISFIDFPSTLNKSDCSIYILLFPLPYNTYITNFFFSISDKLFINLRDLGELHDFTDIRDLSASYIIYLKIERNLYFTWISLLI